MNRGVGRIALAVALVALLGGALSATVNAEEEVQSYIVVLQDEVEDPAKVAAEQTVLAETEADSVYELIFKGYAAELTESGGDAIEVTMPGCVAKLVPQTVAGALSYANEGTGSGRFVRATVSTTSLTYKRTAGICVFLGAEASNGELSGAVEAYGFG